MPKSPPVPKGSPEDLPDLRVVARNLALLIILGVAASAWLLFYTEWFPVVGGILGLGGLFAWIGFLANIIPEETKKRLQSTFQGKVLARPSLGKQWKISIFVLIGVVLFFGTVRFDGTTAAEGYVLKVQSDLPFGIGQQVSQWWTPSWSFVPSHSERRFVLPVGRYLVTTPGLPPRATWVFPLWRRTFEVPGWFERYPVFYVLPSRAVSLGTSNQPKTLRISINGREVYRSVKAEYRGESFWLGCSPNEVLLPEWLRQKIAEIAKPSDEIESRLNSPRIFPKLAQLGLRENDKVVIDVLNTRQEVYASGHGDVGPLAFGQPWPPYIDLREEPK
jgi:hypothetical protein